MNTTLTSLLTRGLAAGVVVVLSGAALLLLGWPLDTATLWAWPIDPPITALVMGAGFASGVYFFSRVALGTDWAEVQHGFLPVALFTWMMAAATLLHWDRFNHGHPAFWVWVATYTVTPIAVPALWLLNRRNLPREDTQLLAPSVRHLILLTGFIGLAVAAWMFLFPDQAAAIWPWSLTPLTARAVAGWIALAGAVGIVVGREARWQAIRLTLHTGAISALMTLIGIARGFADFDTTNPLTWAYVAYIGLPAVLIPALLLLMDLRVQRSMQLRHAV